MSANDLIDMIITDLIDEITAIGFSPHETPLRILQCLVHTIQDLDKRPNYVDALQSLFDNIGPSSHRYQELPYYLISALEESKVAAEKQKAEEDRLKAGED